MEQKSLTPEQIRFRQEVASTILLYTANLCMDLQLNPDFKAQTPFEAQLLEAFKNQLNLPVDLKDNSYDFQYRKPKK